MTQDRPPDKHGNDLRRMAEDAVRTKGSPRPELSEDLSSETMLRMLHEMQVQQVELEIQNEELRLARCETEAMRDQHAEHYELIPAGCVTLDRHGVIANANLATEVLLGIDRSAMIMQPLARYIAPEFQDAYHLKQQAVMADAEAHSCELQMVKEDGTLFWVQLECRTGFDSEGRKVVRCALSDISEQRSAYEDLRASVDFSTSLVHSMGEGLSVIDLDGVATDANPAMCEMTGFSRQELIGSAAPYPYWPPEEYSTIQVALEEAMTGEGAEFELMFMRKNGERFPVIVSSFPVKDRKGEVGAYAATVKDISERRMKDQIQQDSEIRYRGLYQSMMDGFVMADSEGRLTEWNQVFRDMLGYADEELGGLTYQDLTPPKWHEMEARILEEQVLVRGYSDCFEKEYTRADGSVFPVELRATMTCDAAGKPQAFWAIVRDISERKKAEKTLLEWNQTLERRVAERTSELYESDDRFRLLVQASSVGIVVSRGGIILDGNPQFGELFGCDVARIVGQPISDLIAPESRDLVASQIGRASEVTYEFVGMRKDGTLIPLEAHGRMMIWQGEEYRVTSIRDLTEEKLIKEKLSSQKAALDQALRLAIVSEVSAGIIHQIGQPLCAIGANVAAATARLGDCEKCQDGLKIIHAVESDVKRMRELIVHLRALSNPECPNQVPMDLNQMVAESLSIIGSNVGKRSPKFRVELAEGLPDIQGDRVQLSQVVINLISNALDACAECPQERPNITVTTREIPGKGIALSVSDLGTGMKPEDLEQLFTPFFTTKAGGLGIGLRLSQTIAEAHGGSIEGSNNLEGEGMTFQVLLPLNFKPCYTKV